MRFYHYTKEEAFNNIKKSEVLWLCQLGCSNDLEDCRFASYELYHEAIRQVIKQKNIDSKRKKYIQCIIDNFNSFKLYRNDHKAIYGVSLCDSNDNEVLCNSYGNYVIGIDFYGIKEKILKDNPNCPTYWLNIGKVVYNEEDYINLVRDLLYSNIEDRSFYVNYLLEDMNNQQLLHFEPLALRRAANDIYSSVFSTSSILYKSNDWHKEREYRMYIIENSFNDDIFNLYNLSQKRKTNLIEYIKDMGLHHTQKIVNNREYYEFNIKKFKNFFSFDGVVETKK